jgi:hypothetical protein
MHLAKIIADYAINLSRDDVKTLSSKIRNLHQIEHDGATIVCGFSCGVLYVFRDSAVQVHGSIGLDMAFVTDKISDTLRVSSKLVKGKIRLVNFVAWSTLKKQQGLRLLFLDFLLVQLRKDPPKTMMDTLVFNPDVHPDLIVKLCPFKDGFEVTFHFKNTGECLISCDAARVNEILDQQVFKTRARNVMKLMEHVVEWKFQG